MLSLVAAALIAACTSATQPDAESSAGGPLQSQDNCQFYSINPSIETVVADYAAFNRIKHTDRGVEEHEIPAKTERDLMWMGLVDNPSFPGDGAPSRNVLQTMPEHAARDFGRSYCGDLIDGYIRYMSSLQPDQYGVLDQQALQTLRNYPVAPLTDALLYCADSRLRANDSRTPWITDNLAPEQREWLEEYDSLVHATVCSRSLR
ncbi:hypothetical protein [Nocardia puris]|uniref:hypothetical protein n=1 Tax=Nocardia puris TaxID=208602 RepID=UPI002E1CCDE8